MRLGGVSQIPQPLNTPRHFYVQVKKGVCPVFGELGNNQESACIFFACKNLVQGLTCSQIQGHSKDFERNCLEKVRTVSNLAASFEAVP